MKKQKVALAPELLDRKLFDATEQVRVLKLALRKAHRDLARNDALADILQVFRDAKRQPPKWTTAKTPRVLKRSPEVPVAMWADWHMGEVVEPAEVNGFNKYNPGVAEERINRLVETTVKLCREHHVVGSYPGIVIPLTGDFVSGGLHPELAKTDAEEILPTCLRTEELLIAALGRMADEFGRVYVPCVAGNHGRHTAKPEFKRYLFKNFDWLIYRHVARCFRDDPRFTFDIRRTNDVSFRVYGMRYLLAHGDMLGVKGGDGIIGSIGPITRGEVKKSGQASSLNLPFDKLLIGHWHQRLWLPRATVAGTLKGFDEYARLQLAAKPDRPTQPLWFVHPAHGETARWDVYVDDKPDTAREWVSWQTEEVSTRS